MEPSPDGFDAPAIIRFAKPVYEKSAWAVNKTNMKMLMKLYGDDEKRLVGKKIKREVILVRNPQTGENVPGLAAAKCSLPPSLYTTDTNQASRGLQYGGFECNRLVS